MVYSIISQYCAVVITKEELAEAFRETFKRFITNYKTDDPLDPNFIYDFLEEVNKDVEAMFPTKEKARGIRVVTFPCCSENSWRLFVFGVQEKEDVTKEILDGPFGPASMNGEAGPRKQLEAALEMFPTLQQKSIETLLMLDDCTYCT